jgi:hypothetical protein
MFLLQRRARIMRTTNVLQTRSPYRNSSIYTAMLWEMVEGRKRGPTAWFVIRGEQ